MAEKQSEFVSSHPVISAGRLHRANHALAVVVMLLASILMVWTLIDEESMASGGTILTIIVAGLMISAGSMLLLLLLWPILRHMNYAFYTCKCDQGGYALLGEKANGEFNVVVAVLFAVTSLFFLFFLPALFLIFGTLTLAWAILDSVLYRQNKSAMMKAGHSEDCSKSAAWLSIVYVTKVYHFCPLSVEEYKTLQEEKMRYIAKQLVRHVHESMHGDNLLTVEEYEAVLIDELKKTNERDCRKCRRAKKK